MTKLAAIELGSHTARLLVGEAGPEPHAIKIHRRARVYVRLAEGFKASEGGLSEAGLRRAVLALRGFAGEARALGAGRVTAVATGVVREAANREAFLRRVEALTDLRLRVLSGEEEAGLTAEGVLWALKLKKSPWALFDLGGGSTEFCIERNGTRWVCSIPLGAAVLTERFLASDPPRGDELEALRKTIDRHLQEGLRKHLPLAAGVFLAGTGGTAVTLAAMSKRIPTRLIEADVLNGCRVGREAIGRLFEQMRRIGREERARLAGLDEGRAPVILAGTLVILRMMDLFGAGLMTVSLSDLLEGVLMEQLKGDKDV